MNDKVVVITGASRGLGFATARLCLDAGARVTICSEDRGDVRAAEQALGASERLLALKCDVSVATDVEALIADTVQAFGRIDVFINNAAAAGVLGKTGDVPIARGRRVLATNVLGTYYGSVCALRQLEKQGRGRLINVIGRGARSRAPYSNLEGSTKAWIRAFSDNLRREYRGLGIEVGTYDPGLFFSQLTRDVSVVSGDESRVRSFRKLLAVLGAAPEEPAKRLAALALSVRSLSARASHVRPSVLVSRAIERLLLRRGPPFDVSGVVARSVPKERSVLSN